MKPLLIAALIALCVSLSPAFAHSWSPLGWSGVWSGGGTTSDHPENLCQNYTSYACVVAGTQTFGNPLQQWQVSVWNSGGLNTYYLTNNTNTPGWIVVIGVTGLSWSIQPTPGTYNGVTCQIFDPGVASGVASLNWGTARYYYQAVFNGSFGGSLCVSQ